MIKDLCYNLRYIFKPKFWFMTYEYNKAYDEKLNKILDKM